MLAWLDSLCAALTARNDIEVRRLLASPLARHLPRRVRDEAVALTRDAGPAGRPPMLAMQFRHQIAQMLLSESAPPAAAEGQLELPLRVMPDRHESDVTLARAAEGTVAGRRAS